MAILIDTEMPENCDNCVIFYPDLCGLTGNYVSSVFRGDNEQRPDWCPLINVDSSIGKIRYGMIFTVDNLEGMCDLMCDNNINSRNVHEVRYDKMKENYTVGELIESIISIRDMHKGTLTRYELDTLADACNILDKTLDNDTVVTDILYKE